MKKFFLVINFSLVIFSGQSQTQEPYKYMGSYTQPAPNVASLGKFVDYPVGYFTGAPQISIPLYNLQDGAAKTSISLSYHPSGIRVAELASWVGLGWALNAGGMITRSVRGGPDEGVVVSSTFINGYYKDSGIKKMTLLPYPISGVIPSNNNDEEDRKQFRGAITVGKGDAEPDLFTFNFDGYGGKFVFDENRMPRLLTDQDIKIAVIGPDFSSWIITTPDATKYYFGEGGKYEINEILSSGSGGDANSTRPSSWLLTRIVYPNTKDTIYFNYAPETYSYFDLAQETKIFDQLSGPDNPAQACALEPRPINAYKTTVTGYRLMNITSRNYKIVFGVKSTNIRQDLVNSGSNYPYSLDSVKVYNALNQCLKQYVFSYQYFTSTTANNWLGIGGFTFNDPSDTKRLKLVSVKEFSGDGLISKPAYTCNYEETYQLPRRLSYDIDHWGFSNNYPGNINDRFTPTVSSGICMTIQTAANRNSKWPDMQAFSIKSIKDPLGVLTTFEFEPHRASINIPTDLVGGLRIKKITTTDSVTGTSVVRSYSYGVGGTLYKIPQYLFFPDNEYHYHWTTMSYKGYGGVPLAIAIKQSQSIVPLQDFQGNHIGYPVVKETYGANSEGGYKEYRFWADAPSHSSSRLHISNYTASATIAGPSGVVTGTFGNGHFNDILPQNLLYYDGYDVNNYYPTAPPQVDFRRGQLLRESTYDSTAKLIQQVENTYSEIRHEDVWIRGFKVARTYKELGTYGYGSPYNESMTFYKLNTGISRLVSSATTDFKDGKNMSSVTQYKYESAYHTLKTSDSTFNSTGDVIINKTYYSFDYTNGATADNVFGKMKARNMLVPVATRIWKNNQLLNGTVTLYKDFASNATDTFINPSKIYAIENANPLTTVQAGENIPLTAQFTTLLPNSYFKEKASFKVDGTTGKIIEQKLVSDKTQALIWDSNLSLPLAQTENAIITDVAYSSFESSAAGNWTYNNGSVVSDATAPTGGKAYTISGGISKSGLTTTQKYILSYWLKSGATATITGGSQSNSISGRVVNGWTYKQVTITGTASISISGSGSVDELRLHPAVAQMTTYTYDGLLRLIAQCSPNNTVSYYQYDSMNRVIVIKDQFGNVIKTFEYNYGRAARPGN